MPDFCPDDCVELSPTEEEQNAHPEKYSPIMKHFCKRYQKFLNHGKDLKYHPKILRFRDCNVDKLVNWCYGCGAEVKYQDFHTIYIKDPHFAVKVLCPDCVSGSWVDKLGEHIEKESKE